MTSDYVQRLSEDQEGLQAVVADDSRGTVVALLAELGYTLYFRDQGDWLELDVYDPKKVRSKEWEGLELVPTTVDFTDAFDRAEIAEQPLVRSDLPTKPALASKPARFHRSRAGRVAADLSRRLAAIAQTCDLYERGLLMQANDDLARVGAPRKPIRSIRDERVPDDLREFLLHLGERLGPEFVGEL